MKQSKIEQETIILFNEGEADAEGLYAQCEAQK